MWRSWTARGASNAEVAGSNPATPSFPLPLLGMWRNWRAHEPAKLGVTGSSPVIPMEVEDGELRERRWREKDCTLLCPLATHAFAT